MGRSLVLAIGLFALGATACERSAHWQRDLPRRSWFGPLGAAMGPATHPLRTVDERRHGGAAVLADRGGNRSLLVADEDGRALRVIDPESLTDLSVVELAGKPSQVVVAPDGRAYVALRDVNRVVAMESDEEGVFRVVGEAATPSEPYGLAATDEALLVTSAWGAKLSVLRLGSLERRSEISLGREPRGVAVSADGSMAFVAHAMGSRLTRISLADGHVEALPLGSTDFTHQDGCCGGPFTVSERRHAVQGYAVATLGDRAFVPQVLAHPGAGQSFGGYGSNENFPAHQPVIAASDRGRVTLRAARVSWSAEEPRRAFAGGTFPDDCKLPRTAAVDAKRSALLVGCMGIDEVHVFDTSLDAFGRSFTRRYAVDGPPAGIAVDADASRAFVWSQLARTVSVLALPNAIEEADDRRRPPKTAALTSRALPALRPSGLSPEAEAGRRLFFAASDPRISRDGRACASCHPDGRDDGLNWSTPHGARQTPMLAGRLDAAHAPFGWSGDAEDVGGHLKQTLRRLGGRGLAPADRQALVAYCREMDTPTQVVAAQPAVVSRGRDLFFSESTGCSTCHTDGQHVDGNPHDVGVGKKLDTPSLLFVAGTAPYYHDGRYPTLEALVKDTQGKMGWARDLTDADVKALSTFLRTL